MSNLSKSKIDSYLLSRLLRQGVIEAKTRGSRKQRKEKKNRTKKVPILRLTCFSRKELTECLSQKYRIKPKCTGARYRQGQGRASRKEGEKSCYVSSPALARPRTHNILPSKVPGLARLALSCGLPSRWKFCVNKWKNPKLLNYMQWWIGGCGY